MGAAAAAAADLPSDVAVVLALNESTIRLRGHLLRAVSTLGVPGEALDRAAEDAVVHPGACPAGRAFARATTAHRNL